MSLIRHLLPVALFSLLFLNASCFLKSDSEQAQDATPEASTHRTADPALAKAEATATRDSAGGSPASLVTVLYTPPFIWPAGGPLTSLMGPEHPDGIDIGLDAGDSLEIRASARGTVVFAGGSDEDPLGLSVIIDHGDGVTTTYGHLSELLVEEDDDVAQGDLIGIGGSTGTSSGDHLHFEVRKDGATVDPLDVLPAQHIDRRLSAVDCATAPIMVPAGSQSRLDFRSMAGGHEILTARALAVNGAPRLDLALENRTTLLLESAINFHAEDGEDEYRLALTLGGAAENRVLTCGITVQRRNVPATFYVRVEPPDEQAGEDEEVIEPTPTPNPWPQGPAYAAPSSSGVPSYTSPPASGVVVRSPQYGAPVGPATPRDAE